MIDYNIMIDKDIMILIQIKLSLVDRILYQIEGNKVKNYIKIYILIKKANIIKNILDNKKLNQIY